MSTQFATVKGLSDVDQALALLPQSMRRSVVLAALGKGAAPMVEEARARAPRSTGDAARRGSKKSRLIARLVALSETVQIEARDAEQAMQITKLRAKSRKALAIRHGADSIRARPAPVDDPRRTAITVGPSASNFHMSFAELGTSRQKKTPFLRPAFDLHAERAIVVVGEELWKGIERAAARTRAKAESGKLSASSRVAQELLG